MFGRCQVVTQELNGLVAGSARSLAGGGGARCADAPLRGCAGRGSGARSVQKPFPRASLASMRVGENASELGCRVL